ncbi:hypothetical protein [uncultured Cohaesibacter sp.]|uniref:hypothetical protein n=1 Tax=uncultured Cohaesibacter sp. TaxID=1002546 RepID=UPI00292DA496|nr:hypothetical protein [uncultured Cohaesibacter sp.]
MSRRLKPVKDLQVMVLAPRRHDRQLWADLLKNCGVSHPHSIGDVEHASALVANGQIDVVFVDESYSPQELVSILKPARQIEFSGGRGICLILCSKKATAQDVINARKLGFASLVILPASSDTIRKHLELAARYIPLSDEELGWSVPKKKVDAPSRQMPKAKEDPANASAPQANSGAMKFDKASGQEPGQIVPSRGEVDPTSGATPDMQVSSGTDGAVEPTNGERHPSNGQNGHALAARSGNKPAAEDQQATQSPDQASPRGTQCPRRPRPDDADLPRLKAPGRSGQSSEEEVVFL